MVRALICTSSTEVERAFERLFGNSEQIRIVGRATSGGESLALLRQVQADIIAIDGEIDGCEGMRLAGVLMKERSLPVVVAIDPAREKEVRAEAGARGVQLFEVLARKALLSDGDTPARTVLRNRLRTLTGGFAERDVKPSQRPERESIDLRAAAGRSRIRAEVRKLAERPFDAVAFIGSAGTPHLLPSLLSDVSQAQIPIILAVHHNPRLSPTFMGWVEQLVELPVERFRSDAPLRSGARFIVVPAGDDTVPANGSSADVAPDLDAVLHSLLEVPARLLVLVASGMGMQGLDALRRARRSQGCVAALDPAECTYPTMPQAVIGAGLADAVVSSREFGWLIGNAQGEPMPHALAS